MDISYLVLPFITWLLAGITKFAINSIRAGEPAFSLIGYGGMPSNHSAIAGGMTALIALKQGIAHPAFGIAVAFTFIVILDANSLRGQIGKQATVINRLNQEPAENPLRERIGHSRTEIIAGLVFGALVAIAVDRWLPFV